MQRLALGCLQGPSFIGCWSLSDPTVCRDLIDYFELHPERHRVGSTNSGVDLAAKKSTDMTVSPKELREPAASAFATYMGALYECYQDYLEQWPFLKSMLPEADIGNFNIQKYEPGEHYSSVHTERASLVNSHRVLAWMTYLNDVEDGGITKFEHFGLEVTPTRGKTLIWPVEWTHAHSADTVNKGLKYIITGWLHFPPPRPLGQRRGSMWDNFSPG